jgi:hypothetical protein
MGIAKKRYEEVSTRQHGQEGGMNSTGQWAGEMRTACMEMEN